MNTPKAALVLARRHVSLAKAHGVLTRLLNEGSATVEVPKVDSLTDLHRELAESGIAAETELSSAP